MSLARCFYLQVAFATRQSELMLLMYFYFSCLLVIQRSSLDSVLACFLFGLVECGFVIHAQIEKCSQVIHDDRRTGSRAFLLC